MVVEYEVSHHKLRTVRQPLTVGKYWECIQYYDGWNWKIQIDKSPQYIVKIASQLQLVLKLKQTPTNQFR